MFAVKHKQVRGYTSVWNESQGKNWNMAAHTSPPHPACNMLGVIKVCIDSYHDIMPFEQSYIILWRIFFDRVWNIFVHHFWNVITFHDPAETKLSQCSLIQNSNADWTRFNMLNSYRIIMLIEPDVHSYTMSLLNHLKQMRGWKKYI